MIQLIPMNAEDYEAFMQVSRQCFAQDQVLAGEWRAEEAEKNMAQLSAQLLPAGMATPGHTFQAIKDDDQFVGGLWYTIEEEKNGERQLFVMDIEIFDAYRRRGYGSQAFLVMEEQARQMGIPKIVFHVFMHNHQARAMYKKLGYAGEETLMWKKINPSS